jgi:hypothetical protein
MPPTPRRCSSTKGLRGRWAGVRDCCSVMQYAYHAMSVLSPGNSHVASDRLPFGKHKGRLCLSDLRAGPRLVQWTPVLTMKRVGRSFSSPLSASYPDSFEIATSVVHDQSSLLAEPPMRCGIPPMDVATLRTAVDPTRRQRVRHPFACCGLQDTISEAERAPGSERMCLCFQSASNVLGRKSNAHTGNPDTHMEQNDACGIAVLMGESNHSLVTSCCD